MAYIGTSPSNGVRRVHTYTATANQTTFTGSSTEGVTLTYADTNYIDVFQNGVLLGSADYTSTSGTSVVLAQGASVSDLVVIVVYDVFSVADTVSKTSGGSFDSAVTMSNNLTVSGDLASSTSGTSNFRAGVNAGNSIASGSNYNTVVGDEAGTAITTGDNNVAVGYNALATNTTASTNTAVGYQAAYSNQTGVGITAFGANALYATTASDNCGIGTDNPGNYSAALESNTTGRFNTAVATGALGANTTGQNNTAIGHSASAANTEGNSNVAIGKSALAADTKGANNIAIGENALQTQNFTSATNSYNIGIGSDAGKDITDGERNILIGGIAGDEITTADDTVAIGYRAGGGNAAAATTGHDNVCIGTDAGEKIQTSSQNVFIGRNCADEHTAGGASVVIGYLAGVFGTAITTAGTCTLIGSYTTAATVDATSAVGLGHSLTAATGYTTLGHGSSDIRAAHGNTTWSTVSDERYKKDITDSTAGLGFINDLRPRTFKYKNLGDLPNTFNSYEEGSTEVFKNANTNHGFIAQEVKTAIDAHSEIKDGFTFWDHRDDGSQEVAEAALIPILTKAVQELSAQVTALTNRITALENGE